MKRRQFTHTLALLAGGFAASAYAGIAAPYKLLKTGAASRGLSRKQFDGQIGGTFHLTDEAGELRLRGIEDAGCSGPCEQFHLVFELGPGSRLEEGIHRLDCPDGSRMNLYLIPSDRGTETQQLVSIFNLLPAA